MEKQNKMKKIRKFSSFNLLEENKESDIEKAFVNLGAGISDSRIGQGIEKYMRGSDSWYGMLQGLDRERIKEALEKIRPHWQDRDLSTPTMQNYIYNTLVPLVKNMK